MKYSRAARVFFSRADHQGGGLWKKGIDEGSEVGSGVGRLLV